MSDEKNENPQEAAAQPQVPAGQSESPAALPSAVPAAAPVSAAISKAELKAAKVKAKADAKLAKVREKEAALQAKAQAKAEAKAEAKSVKPAKDESAASQSNPAPVPVPSEAAAPAAALDASSSGTQETKASPKEAKPAQEQEKSSPLQAETAQPAAETSSPQEADEAKVTPAETQSPAETQTPAKAPASEPVEASLPESAVPPAEPKNSSKSQAEPAKAEDLAVSKTRDKPETAAKAEPVEKGEENSTAVRRRKKLERARSAAARDAEHSPKRRKTGAVLLSVSAVLATGGLIAAGSLLAPVPQTAALPAAVTSLPAGDALSVCAATPQLLKGVDGTDPQFAPGAKEISSNLRSVVVSDLANRIPGSTFSALGSSSTQTLTDRLDDDEAAQSRSANDQGLTGRSAKVSTVNNADGQQIFRVQPLGELPSIGSSLRSYQAKDGDLAGLAAASCQTPASTLRFTGLQTTTGSTSVLYLANPTSTSAQVAVDLRGPEGPIDTSTLQNVVIAPGEQRAIVLGGYAQDLATVAATITSTGGKVTGYVQQAALRGLTPSGVDLVASNASASNTQVIPGVWIDSKNNSAELSQNDKSLVPQLHIAAAGAQGAGFTVKVLGTGGEVAASFDQNLAVSSNATSVLNLDQLAGGYYTVVVEADAPVTASVKMVRGVDPQDASDTAWAVSTTALAGNQVMPLSANGTGKFVIAATDADSSLDAIVVDKNGKLQDTQKLSVKAGQSLVFDPRETSEDAQAVIFSSDANAYIAQVILGSEQSLGWAAMPAANAGRDGIVVNVAG